MATTTRKYKGKVYRTHLLRRTYRVGKQVKHETLGNISHLPGALIDIIRRSLSGESFVPASEAFTFARRTVCARQTAGGLAVHSFSTLLAELGTRCRNRCRTNTGGSGASFKPLTELIPLQAKAFRLLGL